MRLLKKGVQIGVSVQLPIDIKAGLSRESLDLDAELTMWWPTQQGVQNKDGDERSPTLGQDGNTLVPNCPQLLLEVCQEKQGLNSKAKEPEGINSWRLSTQCTL